MVTLIIGRPLILYYDIRENGAPDLIIIQHNGNDLHWGYGF